MERNIKFEDIVKFIETAIEENCEFEINSDHINVAKLIKQTGFNETTIRDYISIAYRQDDEILILVPNKFHIWKDDMSFDYIIKVDNRKDILTWNMLLEQVKEYVFYKFEQKFNNFFEDKPELSHDLL